MDAANTVRCIAAATKRCLGEDQAEDWVLALHDSEALTRGQRNALRKMCKEKKFDEVFRLSCSYAYGLEDRGEKISEMFQDEGYDWNPKSAEIVCKLFTKDKISEELGWILDSWNMLIESDEVKGKTQEICPRVLGENWLLDFIHYILTTENSYLESCFVSGAKRFIESQHEAPSSSDSDDGAMEVDGEVAPYMETSESYVGISISSPSAFQTLNSDGEEKDDDEISKTGIGSSSSPSKTDKKFILPEEQPVDEILKQVVPFQTESPVEKDSHDWEIVDPPEHGSKPSQSEDNERTDGGRLETESVDHAPHSSVQTIGVEDWDNAVQTTLSKPQQNQTNVTRIYVKPAQFNPTRRGGHKAGESKKVEHSQQTTQSLPSDTAWTLRGRNQITGQSMDGDKAERSTGSLPCDPVPQDGRTKKDSNEKDDQQQMMQDDIDSAAKTDHVLSSTVSSSPEVVGQKVTISSNDGKDTSSKDEEQDDSSASKQEQLLTPSVQEVKQIPATLSSPERKIEEKLQTSDGKYENVTAPEGNGQAKRPMSRSSSDSSQNSDQSKMLDWFSTLTVELDKYKINIQMLAKLTWPKLERLVEERTWPYKLLSHLEDISKTDEKFVDLFISACKRVFERTKPLADKPLEKSEESGASWTRSNCDLIRCFGEDANLLYRLAWPGECINGGSEVLDKLLAKCPVKKQRKKLKYYSHAAKMLMQAAQQKPLSNETASDPVESRPEKAVQSGVSHSDKQIMPSQLSEDKDAKKVKGVGKVKKMIEMFGTAKKDGSRKEVKSEKKANEKSSSKGSKHDDNVNSGSNSVPGQEATPAPIPSENETTTAYNQKPGDANPDQYVQSPADDGNDDFHDTVENLEEIVLLTAPATDDSFELRAVCAADPAVLSLYVVENCWYNWKSVKMNYNRQRNFFCAHFPLPDGEFWLQYKYYAKLEGYKDAVYEYLPGHGHMTNHAIMLKEGVRYVHDVPIFHSQFKRQGEKIQDIIARVVHHHLPPALPLLAENESYVSFKNEICEWANQTREGWRTTDHYFQTIHLHCQEFDIAVMKWMIQLLVTGNEMHVLNRVLFVLNMLVALHKMKHKIRETKLVQIICAALNIQELDLKHQKKLYQLIRQEFGTKESSACPAVAEALIWLYQQLSTVLSSSSPWMEWILSLPLYWIVVNCGEIRRELALSKKGGGLLHAKSSLPEANQLAWSDVRARCKNDVCQRALIAMSDDIFKISELHPWIVGSFMYMLTEQSLLRILKEADSHAIVLALPVDSVFFMILKEWKTRTTKHQGLDDVFLVRKFFGSAFDNLLDKERRWTKEDQLKHKLAARNMLMLILKVVGDFANFDIYAGYQYRNYVFIVTMANRSAELIFKLSSGETIDDTRGDISFVCTVICQKISKFYQMSEDEIKMIDALLRIQWSDKQLQTSWVDHIRGETQTLIKKVWKGNTKGFLEFYVESAEKYTMQKDFAECIENYAFECTENLLKDFENSQQQWYRWSSPHFSGLFGKLFEKEYDKVFADTSSEGSDQGIMKCLQFVVNWTFAPRFYQDFYSGSKSTRLSTEVCKKAGTVQRLFRQAVNSFCSGSMQISETEYFTENREAILKFYSTLLQKNTEAGHSVDFAVTNCLDLRKTQIRAIKTTKKHLESFILLCEELEHSCVVDVVELQKLPLLNDALICDIIDPDKTLSKPIKGLDEIRELPGIDTNELEIIDAIHNSKTFGKVWGNIMHTEDENSSDTEEKEFSWRQVLEEIWPTAKDWTFSAFSKTCDGSIAVSVLIEIFKFSGGDESLILDELLCLAAGCSKSDEENLVELLKKRSIQVGKILHLKKSEKASHSILNLKEVLNLAGDFQCLELLASTDGNEEIELQDVDLNVGENFSDKMWSDSSFVTLLEKFVEQKELIIWLRREMTDLKEVQTFCDLGMISAGETSYEVDRVSFLLSSVMGFSPLIFDLKPDAGLKEVMEKCRIVQKNAASDDKLLEKWIDTARQLTWFEGIHKLHGSVGTQSLNLAQDINRGGIYLIERPDGSTPTTENCLKLILRFDGEVEYKKRDESGPGLPKKVPEKKMTYNDLKDLQSKLMLIAGEAEQGHQDVALFNDILGAVANLAQAYINLFNAGCMLFNNWSAKIVCNKDDILICLNFSDDAPAISTSTGFKDLELLVEVMNKSLIQWNMYIDNMRHKHYYLNDYNIKQIMYLCEKLAKSDFTDQVFSLLSDLCRMQVCDHIQDALDKATEIQEDEEIVLDESPEGKGELSELEQKSRMVRELIKNGLSENIAKAAVQSEDNKDIEDCENWALLHGYDEDLVTELSEDFDEEAGFGPETNNVQTYTSFLHNRTTLSLKELINQIQEGEMKQPDREMKIHSIVKTICSTYNDKTSKLTLQDSLSINHLGKFLTILREKLGGRVDRKMLAPMQHGKANLVLIPTGDMLYTTLTLYMQHQDQPLPTKSEVLVCTEHTSEDEAGRFLRRAMCRNPRKERKLFCMVFGDKLTFSVSTHIESFYNSLSARDNLDHNFQLVIFCSAANQQHYLVTCFDRTKVELKLVTERKKLSEYLFNKLKADKSNKASVKMVSSKRSGVGKSLHVKRIIEELGSNYHVSTIRLLDKEIDTNHILSRLYREKNIRNEDGHLVHFDLTSAVESGIEEFSFNLFILGSIQDSLGQIWRHHSQHEYVVEMTESNMLSGNSVLNLIPATKCLSPKEVLEKYKSNTGGKDEILMDRKEFESDTFQRPYQYLKLYDAGSDLDKFHYTKPDGFEQECIETLLKHCGMKNPSWAQLRYFSTFLNIQLINCEESIFCRGIQSGGRLQDAIEFRGLKAFAVYFMIKMAQDFATPSLHISDESTRDVKDALQQYTIRRRWEDEIHPFVFFNEDRTTMTFINVNVDESGNLLHSDGSISRRNFISKRLLDDLESQGVPFGVNFNDLPREDKIGILCQFMNIPQAFDPDKTYELTTDNVLKMLAIYMRLRSQIPVIIMGETGCGKTRMVEFMSKMRSGPKKNARNMVTLKIHGGIRVADIYQSVKEAKGIAEQNKENFGLNTILFYDEANTTSAIYAIKEVVCDFCIDGEDFRDSQLQIVAACNPYKQLSEKAVKKLEESGLGYNIKANEAELVGHIPMRRLVYRVVPLPPSMQPFVWDFGQLGNEAEEIYIKQMTNHLKEQLELRKEDETVIHSVLFQAQCYMRQKCKDESRYVSLRDVERSLKAFRWFYDHSADIFPDILEYHDEKKHNSLADIPRVLRCLLQTISICYHASLDDRKSFRQKISQVLRQHSISLSEEDINDEIIACQTVFTESLKMDDNIACNEALRENVFLMTVCTDLRIPLFVVGKPGSSKSLAKTIVGDNMQGKTSHCELYRHFKQVHMLSYQCSALTDAEGIESIFNQCAQLQSNQDIDSYTAVVVLDEIGLAEDSPNMPLKVLHPLLECGSTKNGTLTDFDKKRKVAFVGISNWALDPAKMNRGIFLTRGSPTKEDLETTAEGIFENQKNKMRVYKKTIKSLTKAYLKLYKEQKKEYFGLRDYYSLIKMLHQILQQQNSISQEDIENALQRNFSGGEKSSLDVFQTELGYSKPLKQVILQHMIEENLEDDKSRFLLLLTNQYSSFSLLQNFIPEFHSKVQVIFGSSFPNDHSYTEMCRNINRVKVCMETGRTVILLNMTEINESLYDALNQHYVTLGGQRYVDLGLGGHRVKCRIGDGFRLIVVELKDKVYNEYPIPLINRLEKHHLTSKSLLSESKKETAAKLGDWVEKFSDIRGCQFMPAHAFLGFHEDTASSVVISYKQDLQRSKNILLESATMDAVFRLAKANMGSEGSELLNTYIEDQTHDNLWRLIKSRLEDGGDDEKQRHTLLEIITYSNILSDADRKDLEYILNLGQRSIMLLSLQQFQTEQDYLKKLDDFINFCNKTPDGERVQNAAVLLVQCPQAHKHTQLIACARYGLKNKLSQLKRSGKKIFIALLLSTERKFTLQKNGKDEGALSLQHSSDCEIIYVDELRPSFQSFGRTSQFYGKTIRDVLEIGKNSIHPTGEDDEFGIHFPTLLNDCVCEAMAKVKSKRKNDHRNLECVQILCRLFQEDNEINYHFLEILLTKMVEIYTERETEMDHSNWIVTEACSAERLQEGGTFAKTLWLCLKRHVSLLLAYIVSLIDTDDNLNIIADTGESSKRVHNMWMEMFNACRVKWEDMRGHVEFATESKPYQLDCGELRIPFFFMIHRTLEEHWFALQEDHRDTEKRRIFFNTFCSSNPKMNKAIANALKLQKPMDLVYSFARNLIKVSYTTKSVSALANALVKISKLLFEKLRNEEESLPGSHWFLILFYCSKAYHQHLNIVSDILTLHPDSSENMDLWIQEMKQDSIMIHKKALDCALQRAKEKALLIRDSESCCDWIDFARRLRTVFQRTLTLLDEEDKKKELLQNWEPLALLDLLLLHLLPNPKTQESAFRKYVEVIASHAKLLYKGLSKSGVRGQQILRIVCNVLRKYYEDIRLKVLLLWQNTTCRTCRKVCRQPTILPCGHYFCCSCLKNTLVSSQDQKKCPSCSTVLPADYEIKPTELTNAQNDEVEKFKSHCTSFFLEYLHQFAFPSKEDRSEEDVIRLTIDELLLGADIDATRKTELEKLGLSLNDATKTSILSILLAHDRVKVENHLNRHLREQSNPGELAPLIIKHFEQHMKGKNSLGSSIKLLKRFMEHFANTRTVPSVELLDVLAGARCGILNFVRAITAKSIPGEDEITEAEKKTALYNVKTLISSDDSEILKRYLVKVGCRLHGMDWFSDVFQKSSYKDLVPELLKSVGEMAKTDCFTTLGPSYCEMRSRINKTAAADVKGKVKEWLPQNHAFPEEEVFLKVLAIASWLDSHHNYKQEVTEYFQSTFPENAELLDCMFKLVGDGRRWVQGATGLTNRQKSVLEQLIPVVAAVVDKQPVMMSELKALMGDPAKVSQLYWPAMPESFYFSMPPELRCEDGQDAMYQCPNGHFYTIGQCTKPWTISRCPDCHAVIGGKGHVAQAGNERVKKLEENSQAGYMLRSQDKNLQSPEDRISMQAASVIQLLIHTCMLIGLKQQPVEYSRILQGLSGSNATEYLLKAMQRNMDNLTKSVGRNGDEAMHLVFSIMLKILNTKVNPNAAATKASWQSIEQRKDWEKHFRATFLLPVFQNINNAINTAQQNLNAAEDMSSFALFRHVHEVKGEELALGDDEWWKSPCNWHYAELPNSSHLMQCIRDNPDIKTDSILRTILESANLDLVHYLPDVLSLHQGIVDKYQNKFDLGDAENKTIREFLREDSTFELGIRTYQHVWNEMRHKLQGSVECDKQMSDCFGEEISLTHPLSLVLPSGRGRGRCAKLLAEQLVEIQNQFLLKCFEIAGINASENELEATRLSPSHFVRINKQSDLLPLIALHTSCTMEEDEYGRRHHISYNIEALEKQALETFIRDKKVVLTETLPKIKYTQDVGIGTDWENVMIRTRQQDPLTTKLKQTVDDAVATATPAEVCEGVRTLTYAISFLAKVETEHSGSLHEYLERDLLLAKSRTAMIPRFAKIHHTLGLYQHLTWHRSVNFVQQGLHPYQEALYQVEQVEITDEKILKAVRDAFEHMDVVCFQQHLNEMLIKVPDYEKDWSLVDDIFPNLLFIGNEPTDDTWFEGIPPEICFKHVSHLFRLAVHHVENAA